MKRLLGLAALIIVCAFPASASASALVYYAAGDIACAPGFTVTSVKCHHAATAAMIPTTGVNGVITLGDNQYAAGTLAEFTGTGTFNATWGTPFASILHPTPGNHEWTDPAGAMNGYKTDMTNLGVNWSAPISTNCPADVNGLACGYTSWNDGQWHFVTLDSECPKLIPPNNAGGCSTTSKEYKWLQADLNAINQTTQPCLLVTWHRPRFSSGNNGSAASMDPIWKLLAYGPTTGTTNLLGAYTADIVLNGHDHDFERFARQDGNAVANAAGIREFVVGTGGDDLGTFGTPVANSELRTAGSFGVLKLELNSAAYFATFLSEDGLHNSTRINNGCHV